MRLWSQYISFGGSMTYLVHTFRLPGGLVLCYSLRMTDRLMSITMMPSSTIINCHQLSIIIINYIISYHQLLSTIINYINQLYHQLSSTTASSTMSPTISSTIINSRQLSVLMLSLVLKSDGALELQSSAPWDPSLHLIALPSGKHWKWPATITMYHPVTFNLVIHLKYLTY